MSVITGILVIAFSATMTLAAVIPSEEVLPTETPLVMDSETPKLDIQTISDDTESAGDIPTIDNDITPTDIAIVDDTTTDSQENPDNKACEFDCPNPRDIDLEAQEFPVSDLNTTDLAQSKSENDDEEKKLEVLNKIESALKNAQQSKCCSCPTSTAPVRLGLPMDMVPIFKPRRYGHCDNKETDTNIVKTIPKQINTEIQYAKPLCSCNTVNRQNIFGSDNLNAILKTKSYPSTNCYGCNSLDVRRPPNAGINIVNRNYNSGCSCNNRPLKTVQITKAQGNIDYNDLSSQYQYQNNIVSASNRNNPKIVIFKPEKVVVEEAYGQFLKKRIMDVLIPYYVSQLPV